MAERMAGLPSSPENSDEAAHRSPLNLSEYLDIGSAAGACIGHNIETAQQHFSVGAHGHDSAALSSGSAGLRAVDRLGKVQVQFIDPWLKRNRVAKLSLSAAEVEIWVLRAPDRCAGLFTAVPPSNHASAFHSLPA